MTFKEILSTILLVLLGIGVVWAGDPWEEKPWTEWTRKEASRIVEKSPWASKRRIKAYLLGSPAKSRGDWSQEARIAVERQRARKRGESPPLGDATEFPDIPDTSRPSYAQAVIRWVSSRTMREAVVRLGQLEGKRMDTEEVDRFLSLHPKDYMIGVFGSTGHQSAYLELQNKKRVLPVAVEVVLEGAFEPVADLLFYFPRQINGKETIGPDERKVIFVWQVGEREIKIKFDLLKMLRDSKPDL